MEDMSPAEPPVDVLEPAEEGEASYVLLPILGELGYYAVFQDGSFTRWTPGSAAPTWDRSRV